VGQRIPGIKPDRQTKFLFCLAKIAGSPYRISERAMSLSQGVVQLQGFSGRGHGSVASVVILPAPVDEQHLVAVSEAGIGMGIVRIVNDCLRKVVERAIQAIGGSLIPFKAALEVEVVSQSLFGV